MDALTLRVKQNPGTIELNFDELNKQMDSKLAEYKGAVFTEETKDIAKGEVASLRRLKKDVEDARKSAKKEWMKPLDSFEIKMKELSAKVDEPISFINEQLDEFERKRKAEKKKKILELYENAIGDMKDYLPIEKIYDSKWENATATIKSIGESITTAVESTRTAVDTISGMQSESMEKALQLYKNTLDMAKAISYINDYERQRAEIMKREEEKRKADEERQRQAEINRVKAEERAVIEREERIRQEERKKAEADARAVQIQSPEPVQKNISPTPLMEQEEDNLPFEQPTTTTAFYKVVASESELEEMEMVLNGMGIWFERRGA